MRADKLYSVRALCYGLSGPFGAAENGREQQSGQIWPLFEKLNGMECCECGTCTYVCPAKRRLTQAFSRRDGLLWIMPVKINSLRRMEVKNG